MVAVSEYLTFVFAKLTTSPNLAPNVAVSAFNAMSPVRYLFNIVAVSVYLTFVFAKLTISPNLAPNVAVSAFNDIIPVR
jgi:hypothetical protein